jgi:amidophosphoribosyltransferase
LNFSTSRSTLDLAGRKAIAELESADDKVLAEYATAGSERNQAVVDKIRHA